MVNTLILGLAYIWVMLDPDCLNVLTVHYNKYGDESLDCGLGAQSCPYIFLAINWLTIRIKLPWWLSGEEFACQCTRHRFNPSSRKILHATEQLSLITEPTLQSPGVATTESHAPQRSCSIRETTANQIAASTHRSSEIKPA